MNDSRFAALLRALSVGALSRRALGQGLAGGAIATGLAQLGRDDADAKRRGKKRKKKGKGRKRRGGNNDRCQFAICEGVCVDLDTDPDNCGACGEACPDDTVCVGGLCAFALGTFGSGDRQFDRPAGVSFDAIGVSFAADTNNHRVARFAGAQSFDTFGERGDADGQFLKPVGVAVSGGDVYVADVDRHRIQRLDTEGTFEVGVGRFGAGLGEFNAPHGIAFDATNGLVFVADTGNHRVQLFNRSLDPLNRFGRQGSGEGEFEAPQGIAANGNVVVADTGNHRIQVLDQQGNVIRAFGRQGAGDGEFDTPTGVAIDPNNGDIFVVDRGNDRFQRFTSDGQFITAIGRQGTDVGAFDGPFGIAVASQGFFMVSDQGNDRIQFFFPASLVEDEAVQERLRFARKGGRS